MIQYTSYKIQYIFKNVRDTGYMLHDTVNIIQDTVYICKYFRDSEFMLHDTVYIIQDTVYICKYFRDTGVLHWFQDQRLLDPEVKNNSRISSHTHLDRIYQVKILEYSNILI